MVDCGFSIRETECRLSRLGLAPADIGGIAVTHEHQDHIAGVFKFARRHDIPVWLSSGTCEATRHDISGVKLNFCSDGEAFMVGGIELHPYTVPHDARQPLQYVLKDGESCLGVLTDAGQSTPYMIERLSGCDGLVLECNHDRHMLAHSYYPDSLKRRIGGPFGHLSNETAAEILAALDQSRLKKVVGAHLSRKNNTHALAYAALSRAVNTSEADICIACQDEGFGWIDLS